MEQESESKPVYMDIMIDLETTGTDSATDAVFQLAAVKFNLEKKLIGPMFCKSLQIPKWKRWKDDTRTFWGQRRELFNQITSTSEKPDRVMRDFFNWFEETPFTSIFWSKPISFDYPFFSRLCQEHGYENPFPYWLAKDVNTYLFAKNGNKKYEGVTASDEHNALSDCLAQIENLFTVGEPEICNVVPIIGTILNSLGTPI